MRLYRLVLVVWLCLLGASSYAQDTITAETVDYLHVRDAPSPDSTVITTLDLGTTLLVQGRNESGNWLRVSSDDGTVQGWVAFAYVTFNRPVAIMQELPVIGETTALPESSQAASAETPSSLPTEAITADIAVHLNVRQRPSTDAAVLATLDPGTTVQVEARNDAGDWLLIHSADNTIRGWVAIGFVEFNRPVAIMHELVISSFNASASNAEPGAAASVPLPGEVIGGPAIHMDSAVLNHVLSIYARGQASGANPNMLMLVGDSNLDLGSVLCNFEHGVYDLGPYTQFQPLIDDFNSSGAFCHRNITTGRGFSTFNIIDPAWAPDDRCGPNETPLDCEVRLSRPAYALIYIGPLDLELIQYQPEITQETYRANLTTIVTRLTELNVIPILSTFPTADYFNPGSATAANTVIREVAAAMQVPLIDLRAVTYDYENHGAAGDGYHMRTPLNGKSDFNGNQNRYARTQYEFQVLDILNQIRSAVGGS